MCPSSAPAPIQPRYGLPPRISPPPTPVPSVSMTMSLVPRPAPARHSAIAAAFPSLSIATGSPSRSRITSRKGTSTSGMFTEPIAIPRPLVDPRGDPEPDRDDALVEQLAHRCLEAVEERLLGLARGRRTRGARRSSRRARRGRRGSSSRRRRRRSRSKHGGDHILPGAEARPAGRSPGRPTAAVTIRRMPSEEKPYRVYRGGRVKGKVPTPKPERSGPRRPARPAQAEPALAALDSGRDRALPRARPRLGARELLPVPGRRLGGEQAARPARPRRRSTTQHGDATDILLLGTDHAQLAGRESANRSDSITLVRVDTEPAPDRVPLDPARPASSRSPGTATRRSTRRCSSAAPALAVETVHDAHRPAGQPRRRSSTSASSRS